MKTRGGQKVKADHLNMELTTLCEHSFDCGASVFYFLGYSDLETSKYLARRSLRGLHNNYEVLPMMTLAYNNVRWEPITAIENLNPNEATMAFIMFQGDTIGHYIIIYRKDESFLRVIDPQLRKNIPLDEYLKIDERDMIVLDYINSDNVIDVGAHRVTREIIDTVLGPAEPKPEDLDYLIEPSDDFLDNF